MIKKNILFYRLNKLIDITRRIIQFKKEFNLFRKMSLEKGKRFDPKWSDRYPFLYDNTLVTSFDTHYVYHPAWAARILAKTKPEFHVDISSTLHFCSIVSAFIPVHFYDYRPAYLALSNLTSKKADLLSLPFKENSVQSISCMHTIEHVGLGRYGDPIDPDGDLKAISELKRVTAVGGNLLFVVPVGKPKIMFNAHRVYGYSQVIEYFGGFELKDFFLIPDNTLEIGPIANATEDDSDMQNYGCGCFWFIKK